MTTVRYLRASEWGMRWARPPVAERLNDPEAFVHHTAGSRLSSDGAEAFRRLNEAAITAKGYSATDYDFLVHYWAPTDTLTIGEARGKWLSAATRDRNEPGEAICVMGYFHPGHRLSEQPHPAEVDGVALAIKWSMDLGCTARDARILGHRDNPAHPGATGCPGDFLYAHMDTIRQRVAELLAADEPETEDDVPSYQTLPAPVRLMDTRPLTRPVAPMQEVKVGTSGKPEWAKAAVVNITVTLNTGPGFVTAWASGERPNASNVNYVQPNDTVANQAVVPLAADGSFVVSPASSSCHFIVDLQAWAA